MPNDSTPAHSIEAISEIEEIIERTGIDFPADVIAELDKLDADDRQDRSMVAHALWTMGGWLKQHECSNDPEQGGADASYENGCEVCEKYLEAVADSIILADRGRTHTAQPTVNAEDGASLIAAERVRQVTVEGWDAEHDKGHAAQLIAAAREYAAVARFEFWNPELGHPELLMPQGEWPWNAEWFKPTGDPVRDLVKAGALIAAAIDSITGAALATPPTPQSPDRSAEVTALIAEAKTTAYATTSDEVWKRNGVKPIEQNDLLARLVAALEGSNQPEACTHKNTHMVGWTQVCDDCGQGREIQ